jgi:hypothetical protein
MNQEMNSEALDNQQEKPAPSKRSSRGGRKRPVLVTTNPNNEITQDQPAEETNEAAQPVEEVASTTTVKAPRTRRLPNFFSSVARSEQEPAVSANPEAARIARATRSGASPASSRPAKEGKATESEATTRTSTNNVPAPTTPARPRQAGGFKTKYLFGMVLYLIAAEVVGGFERNLLVANHADKLLFQLGSIGVSTSTVLFLLTLLALLFILARLDLVPRSLGAMTGQPPSQRRPGQSQNTSNNPGGVKNPPPTMKQGVKGADDDLYQEYREQQRYLQRRERKK